MTQEKHYVYSARTTEKGLSLLNKTKGDSMRWDQFVNDAVCEHYGLDPAIINLPPSKFVAEREAKKAAKEAAEAKKPKKAATKKTGTKPTPEAVFQSTADELAAKKAAEKTAKPTKTVQVKVKPGQTKVVGGAVHADKDNAGTMEVPVDMKA